MLLSVDMHPIHKLIVNVNVLRMFSFHLDTRLIVTGVTLADLSSDNNLIGNKHSTIHNGKVTFSALVMKSATKNCLLNLHITLFQKNKKVH